MRSNIRLGLTAGLILLAAAAPVAAAPVGALFTYQMPGTLNGPLTVDVTFDDADAVVEPGATRILFPADGGEGAEHVTQFGFSWGMMGNGDVVGDMIFRSLFFDIDGLGSSVFAPVGELSAFASFSFYTIDAGGCAFGLTPVGVGLGTDTFGNCDFFAFDGSLPQVTLARLDNPPPVETPEPAAAALFGLGLLGLSLRARRAH